MVNIIFDAAHMLNLMRNTIAEKGVLTDYAGKQIRWQLIKDLYELQNKKGLKAANKLKRSHVEWYQQKGLSSCAELKSLRGKCSRVCFDRSQIATIF